MLINAWITVLSSNFKNSKILNRKCGGHIYKKHWSRRRSHTHRREGYGSPVRLSKSRDQTYVSCLQAKHRPPTALGSGGRWATHAHRGFQAEPNLLRFHSKGWKASSFKLSHPWEVPRSIFASQVWSSLCLSCVLLLKLKTNLWETKTLILKTDLHQILILHLKTLMVKNKSQAVFIKRVVCARQCARVCRMAWSGTFQMWILVLPLTSCS